MIWTISVVACAHPMKPRYSVNGDRPYGYAVSVHLSSDPRSYVRGIQASLAACTAEDLRAVGERLNNRPRKTFGWQAPASIFSAATAT
jgi:hypothetical protein